MSRTPASRVRQAASPDTTPPDYLRIGRPATVARELGVDHRTLSSAVKRGYVRTIAIFGGDALIDVESARAWLENDQQRTPGPKPRTSQATD